MAETVTIKLSRSYEANGVTFDKVELKQPWRAIYAQLGEPWMNIRHDDGSSYVMPLHSVAAEYVDRLCIFPGSDKLDALTIEDAKRIEEAVASFFMVGSGEMPTTTPAPSSGSSDGPDLKPSA